jgi:phosphoribosylformylglycinamidine cyclo-ligase
VIPLRTGAYARAGVDLEAARAAVERIRRLSAGARRPEVREGAGGFAGLFELGGGRLLAASTDGVGTKLEIARRSGRLETVGIDLVAMCADDVVCAGAEPLFFLDYLAMGAVVPDDVARIVAGVAEGCRRAGCALLGGETAEHPGVMEPGEFDVAGACVGIVDEADVLGPARVREGDVLIGLASTGLHSNGYSLVRSAVVDAGVLALDDVPAELGRSLADELLEPTAIYAPLVLRLAHESRVAAAAHITGGGLVGNVPRVLPEGLGARITRGSWTEPPVFELVRRAAAASDDDMFATFNMGIGMVLVVGRDAAPSVIERAAREGTPAFEIGEVVAGAGLSLR